MAIFVKQLMQKELREELYPDMTPEKWDSFYQKLWEAFKKPTKVDAEVHKQEVQAICDYCSINKETTTTELRGKLERLLRLSSQGLAGLPPLVASGRVLLERMYHFGLRMQNQKITTAWDAKTFQADPIVECALVPDFIARWNRLYRDTGLELKDLQVRLGSFSAVPVERTKLGREERRLTSVLTALRWSFAAEGIQGGKEWAGEGLRKQRAFLGEGTTARIAFESHIKGVSLGFEAPVDERGLATVTAIDANSTTKREEAAPLRFYGDGVRISLLGKGVARTSFNSLREGLSSRGLVPLHAKEDGFGLYLSDGSFGVSPFNKAVGEVDPKSLARGASGFVHRSADGGTPIIRLCIEPGLFPPEVIGRPWNFTRPSH